MFGKTGQVARELQRIAPDARFLCREEADLSDPQACADQIEALKPNCVINAAAYTNVDNAEDESELASLVNGQAPSKMAEAAQKLGIPFVHVSTDYVFDGNGDQPFSPGDPVAPIGAYGSTKLQGEIGVRAVHDTAVILRTSWVFSAHGTNFVKSMLRLGATNDEMKIVADQIGGPTPAKDIAQALVAIAHAQMKDRKAGSTHHFAGNPNVSWAGFAREIFAQSGNQTHVIDIPSADFPTPATRPLNSRLNGESLMQDYGIEQPDWRVGLCEVLVELGEKT